MISTAISLNIIRALNDPVYFTSVCAVECHMRLSALSLFILLQNRNRETKRKERELKRQFENSTEMYFESTIHREALSVKPVMKT
jgi:hypothetical protein